MLNEATLQFVSQHSHDDVRMLALHGCKNPDVDLTLALQQIQGRQTARRKLPSWAANEGIVYPPRLNMEQCSSELTARYKAQLAVKLNTHPDESCKSSPGRCPKPPSAGSLLIDLTGGFGVDFSFMAEAFDEAVYVERDPQLCAIATHNLALLGRSNAKTVCADAESWLSSVTYTAVPQSQEAPSLSPSQSSVLIYLDPARRDTHGQRTYSLADCSPNVVPLVPMLLQHSDHVMLKLSPMLDWRKATDDLGQNHVGQIHIVAVDNECKELLIVLTHHCDRPLLVCTDIRSSDGHQTIFTVEPALSSQHFSLQPPTPAGAATNDCRPPFQKLFPRASSFLYEPNAAIMKAGCFDDLAASFGIRQIAPNSHLFTSETPIAGFPGRRFRIEAVSTMNKRDLKATLGHLHQANIAVRNFPLSVQQLRQRLKLADGGTDYIFATTQADGGHVLLLCSRH